ncbi:type II secretion system protein N [Cognatiluteimonas weifangensis]|nr:type II secretion system protein N [Luteimonas weifangensis]
MIRPIDSLQRLPQSPVAALWALRLAAALVVVLLARLLVLAVSEAQLPLVDAPGATIAVASAPEPLASWHLFGVSGGDGQIAATTLALTLRGIVGSTVPGLATAVIAGQEQQDVGYHVGDTLPGGGVLDAIHADHVVIRNQGRRESLALSDKRAAAADATGALAPSQPASGPSSAAAALSAPAAVPAPAATPALAAPGTAAVGMALLASQANILPVLENGRVVGARISAPDVALLERVGLRRDDVVTAVDGHPVDGPGFDAALQAGLRDGGATLVLRRDGREQTVRVGR